MINISEAVAAAAKRRKRASVRRPAICAGVAAAVLSLSTAVPTANAAPPDPTAEAIAASAAPGHTWSPGLATYGVLVTKDVPVQMSDGTVLRADVATPSDKATGEPAAGPFPVLLTQTPYGKDAGGQANSSALGIDPYFVTHGYIDVAVDVRGTGNSGGTFTLFDPKQADDGAALVRWAAGLPHSTGTVGLHGASYLGIDQMLTAARVGPNSPLKAIFPIVSANDVYRDTAFMGGIPDGEFDTIYLEGVLPLTFLLDPIAAAIADPANIAGSLSVLLSHAQNTLNYNALFLLQAYMGGPNSYDNAYWHQRSPGNFLSSIVANNIPAYLVGGEYDLFQRGEPLNYAGLQNAWAGRPVTAPMVAGQRLTGRYQLLDGPFTHLQAAVGPVMDALELEWFDTWLKGADTGMATTPTPLHYFDIGTGHYANTTTYPITGAAPTTFYFSGVRSGSAPSRNDGSLKLVRPGAATGADQVSWAPVGTSICDRSLDQWAMGALTVLTPGVVPSAVPCFGDDRPAQTGPTALTYTSTPLLRPRTIAGPIAARIYAKATTQDTEWVVNVEDVAPDGTSRPLTQGALLGSHRALDSSRSWVVSGKIVMPYHPYTAAAVRLVQPGALTRYDVEVFPTYATIGTGHRIRVTLQTTDFPHLTPTPPQAARLMGGSYLVQRNSSAASSVTIPLSG